MWFENFIPSLALSLNCLGAFLPGCFILPGSLAFRPGGLGKAAAEASQLGPKRTPSAQGEHLMCPHTHTHPWGPGVWITRPSPAFRVSTLPSPSPPHLSLPSQAPDPQHFKASSPRWVLQKLFPFQYQAGHLLFQMSDKAQ